MSYRTIVVDPPWPYSGADLRPTAGGQNARAAIRAGVAFDRHQGGPFLPYATMSLADIATLPVPEIAAPSAHLYLWTTNKFLRPAFDVLDAWGFRYSQTLAWCKVPMGLGPGPTYANTMEFVLVGKRGNLKPLRRWDTSWFDWPRMGKAHSRKPDAFLDLVEQISPGPYAELFARRARLGWDYPIGDQALGGVAA